MVVRRLFRRWREAILLSTIVLLSACATAPVPGLFTTEVRGFDAERPVYFPPSVDRETPRYRYLGQLVGDDNFIKERAKSGFYRVLEWITGAIFGAATPRELKRPQSGAVGEDGRIYVTDVGVGAVFVFDTVGGLLDVYGFASGSDRFESPIGIAVSETGDIFVADSARGYVAHLSSKGEAMAPIGVGELGRPTGLAYDPEARELYVADTGNHQILVFDMQGHTVQRRISTRGDGIGDVNFPTFLAFRSGDLYVADSMNARVLVFDGASGRVRRQVGERGSYVGQLVRPKGIALDSDQNLYVVESFHDYLLIFDQQGRFLLPIGGGAGAAAGFFLPSGVWSDSRDRIFVADVFNGRVFVLQYLGGDEQSETSRR